MIIFGTRRKVERLGMLELFCRTCNTRRMTSLNKSVTKFTLFFVPLFPVRTTHSLTCTWCGTTDKVRKADVEHLRRQARQQPPM